MPVFNSMFTLSKEPSLLETLQYQLITRTSKRNSVGAAAGIPNLTLEKDYNTLLIF